MQFQSPISKFFVFLGYLVVYYILLKSFSLGSAKANHIFFISSVSAACEPSVSIARYRYFPSIRPCYPDPAMEKITEIR
jgi:hypothetical protein